MKILDINTKNFYKKLDFLLLKRKNKIQSKAVSVTNIIKDVRKNGDKALIKYEKRFNKNSIIRYIHFYKFIFNWILKFKCIFETKA